MLTADAAITIMFTNLLNKSSMKSRSKAKGPCYLYIHIIIIIIIIYMSIVYFRSITKSLANSVNNL